MDRTEYDKAVDAKQYSEAWDEIWPVINELEYAKYVTGEKSLAYLMRAQSRLTKAIDKLTPHLK